MRHSNSTFVPLVPEMLIGSVIVFALLTVGSWYAISQQTGSVKWGLWDVLFVASAIGFTVAFCWLLAAKAAKSIRSGYGDAPRNGAGSGAVSHGGAALPPQSPRSPDPE